MGSFLFHATLKYPMQLVDELSMIYTTCLMCYATFSYSRSRLFSLYLALFLLSLAIFITLYYHYLQDPAFHQVAYAILTAIVLTRSIYVMELNLRPRLKQSENEYKLLHKRSMTADEKTVSQGEDRRDRKILGMMWVMIGYGLTTFLGGFLIWHLDNVYCSKLRVWRRELGLPWGIVLEGHGWWYDEKAQPSRKEDAANTILYRHLMTGTGAYFYLTWGIWLRHCLNGRQDEYDLVWPRIWSLPEIVRTKSLNGHAPRDPSKKTI